MRRRRSRVFVLSTFLLVAGVVGVILLNYLSGLNREIVQRFDGKRWSLPAVVYARPLELYPGLSLDPQKLERELQLAGYRNESPVQSSGGFHRSGNEYRVFSRAFTFGSGFEEAKDVRLIFSQNRIATIQDAQTGKPLPFFRLDPARIGSIHPLVHEDRLVLTYDEIPRKLIIGLMAVEDKNFFNHHGISPTGIFRAILANVKAGRTVQGGSTLTQQLVKNLFVGRERTLSRKLREAVMAILLEYNYSKEEILTAYINEVFLGQDGNRAVHGFGLASHFYFRRTLQDLSTDQLATLIGMVKGPSYYDPRKNEEVSRKRRDTVLGLMLQEQVIDEQQYAQSLSAPLTDVTPQKHGFNRFPAFLDMVRRQLKTDYREEDLNSNGLKIFTTLDPQVQWSLEEQLNSSLAELRTQTDKQELQGAGIISSRETGELLAVVGGLTSERGGFNRALDASRPIGSLVKPAIYLAALTQGYTLASPLMDSKLTVEHDGVSWQPENYDKIEHGLVPLYLALAKSYNLATVRLGIDIGVGEVITTINHLGYPEKIRPYPSLLLGALEMSPIDVSQMYQTIGSGGFYQPLRSISAVMDQGNSIVSRYGLQVEQRFSPGHMYLLNHCLERVMSEGTGSRLSLSPQIRVAGKTGTSNELRDSWFAGYTDSHLAVLWLGNDDNSSSGLTGSSGAMQVWKKVIEQIDSSPANLVEPPDIVWKRIDRQTLRVTSSLNRNSTLLPFIRGTEPESGSLLPGLDMRAIENETRRLLDSINSLFQ